jgi:hypothetical protein
MAQIDAGFQSHALAVENGKFAAVDIMELILDAHTASELVITHYVTIHFVVTISTEPPVGIRRML